MGSVIKAKQVGNVNIFEFWGSLSEEINISENIALFNPGYRFKPDNVLYNLRNLASVDNEGNKTLVQNVTPESKIGFWARPEDIDALLNKWPYSRHNLSVIKSAEEVILYFNREFAADNPLTRPFAEKRQFPRLNTALPLKFRFQNRQGQFLNFHSVITNLSEGGLFAEFIESVDETQFKREFDPLDLKIIHLEIVLEANHKPICFPGKLIHGSLQDEGIGVEFYEPDTKAKTILEAWLEKHYKIFHRKSKGDLKL